MGPLAQQRDGRIAVGRIVWQQQRPGLLGPPDIEADSQMHMRATRMPSITPFERRAFTGMCMSKFKFVFTFWQARGGWLNFDMSTPRTWRSACSDRWKSRSLVKAKLA